ncbi:hypothetical protein HHK36_033374 [Tetracentron sinense]|uniref:Protein kinase domain-containing protein n=1 Tax=Tetracentron sinense TaxID=13715 RepID=A0A834Y3K7_TETSI|nr:hypothetical protein HHK36_033374 [Tetracentron sinense]
MGNCGTREESAVIVAAHSQVQQLHMPPLPVKNAPTEKRHNRSFSDLSDPSTPHNIEDSRKNAVLYTHVIAFTLFELETITKSFRTDYILGEGGFGTVYKGYIDENVRVGLKSLPVAVKVLNKEGLQGHREWLLTCFSCLRLSEATIPLSWATRMMIALGAAKGLAFLHNAERPVIYRDFKTSNILLDSVSGVSYILHTQGNLSHDSVSSYGIISNSRWLLFILVLFVHLQDYTAKLSDFGLAKAGPQGDETHVSTRVMGTYGYAAPEYVMTGHLTAKSDVYSFGVVLLELLTGRRSVDRTRPSKEQSLVDWARPKLNDKRKLLQIIDPRLEDQYSVRAAQKACSLAYYCLSQNPKARPLMSDVVETLEPLQSSGATEVSAQGPVGMGLPDYRMYRRIAGNSAGCQSPNSNCSQGGPAACRVR